MLAKPVKSLIRFLVYWYLDRRQLTALEAQAWARTLKNWPAIFSKPYRKSVDIGFGLSVEAGLIDIIQRTLIVDRAWDSKVLAQLLKYLKPGSTFLDIGANIGYFSLIASHLVGDEGRVVAVEPSRRALAALAANVQRNNLANVIILSVAGGDSFSVEKLVQATPNNIGASSLSNHVAPFAFETVPVVPLQSLIAPLKIVPDVIKIDAEGFECKVLLGIKELLAQNHPIVVCEVTLEWIERNGGTSNEILALMQGLGYQAYKISNSEPYTLLCIDPVVSLEFRFQEELLFKFERS